MLARSACRALLCSLLFAVFYPLGGRAEAPAPTVEASESPEYRRLIGAALDEYEAHNFAEARALFSRAHTLLPSARTLRGLGMAEFELKNYVDSVRQLDAALTSGVKPLNAELRQQTEELLLRAKTFVSRYRLEFLPSRPSDLRLLLNGEPLALAADDVLTLPVGEHVLLASAVGRADAKRSLSVKGAEDVALQIELLPSAREQTLSPGPRVAESSASQADARVSSSRPLLRNPWLWSGVGAVVVGGIVAGIVLSMRKESGAARGDVHDVVTTLRVAR